jgi:hypothetical protein
VAVTISFPPNPEPDVDFYNVYKSNTQTQTGPFTLIGTVDHDGMETSLTYLDATGTIADWYKLEAVNLENVPSLATAAFKPISAANLTRLYDTIYDASQKPAVGLKVEASLSVPQAAFNGIVVPRKVTTLTDQNGIWFLDLYPNSSLSPAGSEYIITIQTVVINQHLVLPVAQTVRYSDLVDLT